MEELRDDEPDARRDDRVGAGWIVVILALQLIGPSTSGDLHDFVALGVLLVLAGATRARHAERPIRILTVVEQRARELKAAIRAAFPRLGVDLRGGPPLRPGLPRLFVVPAIVGTAVVALLAVRPFPDDAVIDDALRTYAYFPYLVGLGTLMLALVFLALMGPFMPFSALRDAFLEMRPRRGDALRELPRRAGYALGFVMVALAVLLPVKVAVGAVFAAAALDLLLVWLPGQGRLTVVWRRSAADAPHRSADWRVLSSLEPALIVVAVGGPLVVLDPWGDASAAWTAAPLTRSVHWLAAWGGAFICVVVIALRLHHVITCSLFPPSMRVRARVHVDSSSPDVARAAAERLTADGWDVDPRGGRRADDLVLRFEEDARPASADFVDLSAPIAPAMLEDETLRWRLRRRSEIRSRRNVMHGLETIFRHASRATRDVGTGFIVAPHQWFFVGVERDIATPDMSDDVGMTGNLHPAYRSVMTRRARHHLWSILNGVGVDLIHVEYGVGFRRLRVAMRILFEVYDVHGGKRHVEERDFVGVHGVHVVVHEVDLEKPRDSQLYPEPEYEQASRARILHLYRDRGGEEEPTLSPVQSDWLPILA